MFVADAANHVLAMLAVGIPCRYANEMQGVIIIREGVACFYWHHNQLG